MYEFEKKLITFLKTFKSPFLLNPLIILNDNNELNQLNENNKGKKLKR